MRALATGGAGFIGSNLVDALVARGDSVRVVGASGGVPLYRAPTCDRCGEHARHALRCGESAEVHGDGEQSRDFSYIDDVVAAQLTAADAATESALTCRAAVTGSSSPPPARLR